MGNVVYIKKVDEYNEVLSKEYKRIPVFLKKVIFIYKNMFNIITKKRVKDCNLWILPIREKSSINKLINLIKKMAIYNDNKYVISDDFCDKELYKLMEKYHVSYLKGDGIKKHLIIKILNYINNIQNEEINNIEVTILANEASDFNIYLIEYLSKLVKTIKVVSPNIYKFKRIEENLYNNYGIAIQFSNSYKKSLAKSKIIINLDYNQLDINEYEIFSKAIIINGVDDNINIKSKLFNGIVINSCNIKFKKEIRDKFKEMGIYHKYNDLVLYESYIVYNKRFDEVFTSLESDKIRILNLIGNNGIINKNEFKNIFKKLDK